MDCEAALGAALEPYSTKPPPNLLLAHQQPDEAIAIMGAAVGHRAYRRLRLEGVLAAR